MWYDVKDNFGTLILIIIHTQLTATTHQTWVRAILVVEQSLKAVKPVIPGATLTLSSTPASTLSWEEQRTFAVTQGDCERSRGASPPKTHGTTAIYLPTALVRFPKISYSGNIWRDFYLAIFACMHVMILGILMVKTNSANSKWFVHVSFNLMFPWNASYYACICDGYKSS